MVTPPKGESVSYKRSEYEVWGSEWHCRDWWQMSRYTLQYLCSRFIEPSSVENYCTCNQLIYKLYMKISLHCHQVWGDWTFMVGAAVKNGNLEGLLSHPIGVVVVVSHHCDCQVLDFTSISNISIKSWVHITIPPQNNNLLGHCCISSVSA